MTASISKLCIPGCLLIHLNIIIQHRHQSLKKKLNWSSTVLNNVFNVDPINQYHPKFSKPNRDLLLILIESNSENRRSLTLRRAIPKLNWLLNNSDFISNYNYSLQICTLYSCAINLLINHGVICLYARPLQGHTTLGDLNQVMRIWGRQSITLHASGQRADKI